MLVYDDMQASKVPPNAATLTTLVKGWSDVGHADMALKLFYSLRSLDIELDPPTFHCLLSCQVGGRC